MNESQNIYHVFIQLYILKTFEDSLSDGVESPNIQNYWLEDEFPFGMAYFQGLCSFQGGVLV